MHRKKVILELTCWELGDIYFSMYLVSSYKKRDTDFNKLFDKIKNVIERECDTGG